MLEAGQSPPADWGGLSCWCTLRAPYPHEVLRDVRSLLLPTRDIFRGSKRPLPSELSCFSIFCAK